ncbi:MAG: glycosyltransferase family 1 protein [Acidobacteria bacterium]|nr:MAG: glycosyltransferase family 1 protein [Acidobacteriota bacterium]
MRVLFDHQILDAQAHGGVSRYFHQLISNLEGRDLATVQLPPAYTDNTCFRPLLAELGLQRDGVRSRLMQGLRKTGLPRKEIERVWRRTKRRHNRQASIEKLKQQDFDLFHPTYYDPYFLDHLEGKPFVLTIYDMIHEMFPGYFKPDDKTSEHKALLAMEAAGIIAISSCTKADILRYIDVDPEKIEVIHLASPLTGESEEIAVPGRYILHVGERCRYKNFRALLAAFAGLAATFPDLHLVCASPKRFDRSELDLIQRLGLADRCVSLSVNDAQLTFLYRHAALLIFPSLYEGFGLPVLEAFACDCPVVLSDTSCLPEIAGDAALYFDPADVASIEGTLSFLLSNSTLRQALIHRGRERLQRFSWATTAERTAAVYKKCLTDGSRYGKPDAVAAGGRAAGP